MSSSRRSWPGSGGYETRPRPRVPLNAEGLVIFREILAEIATNILKYAEPESTVGITVQDDEDDAIIRVANAPRDIRPRAHLSTGVGLPAISQLAVAVGGEIRTVSNSTTWVTELRIPRTDAHTP